MSYSRPSSAPTFLSASRIRRAFSGFLKSVSGSLRNGLSGRQKVAGVLSTVAMFCSFVPGGSESADQVFILLEGGRFNLRQSADSAASCHTLLGLATSCEVI